MAISEAFNGSASIGTTEYDLPSASTTKSSQTTDGIYQLFLDLNALTSTDQYTLKIYEKVQSSSAQYVVQEVVFSGVQAEPVYVTPSLLFLHGWTFTVKQDFGSTARTINWSIRSVA